MSKRSYLYMQISKTFTHRRNSKSKFVVCRLNSVLNIREEGRRKRERIYSQHNMKRASAKWVTEDSILNLNQICFSVRLCIINILKKQTHLSKTNRLSCRLSTGGSLVSRMEREAFCLQLQSLHWYWLSPSNFSSWK